MNYKALYERERKRSEKMKELIEILEQVAIDKGKWRDNYIQFSECKKELLAIEAESGEEEDKEPYFGWCDVDGCEDEGCCGGTGWRETGYWTLCTQHSRDEREGKIQPKMKQSAIDKESKRDKITGYLFKQ